MLKPKVRIDPREKFPAEYHDFLDVFSRMLAERQAPFRPGIDHEIPLEKTPDRQDSKVP